MRYLLDTDVVSQLSKDRPHPAAYAWIQSQADEDIFLSAATLFELRFGVAELPAGKRRDRIEAFVSEAIPKKFAGRIVPMDEHAAHLAARILSRSLRSNWGMNAMDAITAATAMVNDMTLATLNRKHFDKVGVPLVAFESYNNATSEPYEEINSCEEAGQRGSHCENGRSGQRHLPILHRHREDGTSRPTGERGLRSNVR